jgi:hypothetical protein
MKTITIDKNNNLTATINNQHLTNKEEQIIIELLNRLELFANIDSGDQTDISVQKNREVLAQLIERGVEVLHYDISVIGGANRSHYFIEDGQIDQPIVYW